MTLCYNKSHLLQPHEHTGEFTLPTTESNIHVGMYPTQRNQSWVNNDVGLYCKLSMDLHGGPSGCEMKCLPRLIPFLQTSIKRRCVSDADPLLYVLPQSCSTVSIGMRLLIAQVAVDGTS
jgi:hypothetical protein